MFLTIYYMCVLRMGEKFKEETIHTYPLTGTYMSKFARMGFITDFSLRGVVVSGQ